MAADGGRNAARGLRYQYLRTLEALADAAEEPVRGVTAVHVEGLPAPDGKAPESIDYELTGDAGVVLLAAQVKARAPGAVMGAGEAFRALAGLVKARDADRYALLTSASEGDSARDLAALLGAGLPPAELRAEVGRILAGVSAEGPLALLAALTDEHLTRLVRAVIEFDSRDDAEITDGLRRRLRAYRNSMRTGLGNESAGLLVGYLVSEIFRRAATPADATVLVSDFQSAVLVDGATLSRVLGRRDWGVVVGSLPARPPDVRRAELLERIEQALPLQSGTSGVRRCTLTGMSGIGKTSLACGYLLERADVYDVIFWADAESERALASSFAGIFGYLHGEGVPEPEDPARLREAVLTGLSCMAGRWLLILDNCADERLADPWIPKAGDGHVIVTALDSGRPPHGEVRIEVGSMPAAQAVDLLARRLAPGAAPDGPQLRQLARLARKLEGWPLALEVASAYLHRGGYGIDGIPDYLERLVLPSLRHGPSRPPDYPRTLIAAIDLCLDRIGEAAGDPDSEEGWASLVALGMLRIAAYMSSRRIPVYLLMSVPAFDPSEEQVRAFGDLAPVVADRLDRPPGEVVGVLRAYSLMAVDERLPPSPAGDRGNGRYDYTITVNSVLQDVMRARYDHDPLTGMVIDRLAWHTERWLKAAYGLAAHERALVLAAHAAAVEGHASRLGLATDSVAFLRGNLAAVEFRQNRKDRVIGLLRSEIEHYRGRDDADAQSLTCQASLQLATVLAEEDHAEHLGEITNLLETAYLYLASSAAEQPERAALPLASARSVLSHLQLAGASDERLTRLATAVQDLAGRMPDTAYSAALRKTDEIKRCLDEHRDCRRAAREARTLLADEALTWGTQESVQLRVITRKLLIEALTIQRDVTAAHAELDHFTVEAQPPLLFVREIQDMLHNTGYCAALLSLAGMPDAARLLTTLLAEGRPDLVRARYPGETAERIGLLCGVSAFRQGDLPAARRHLDEFLAAQARPGDMTTTQKGWRKLAGMLGDAIATRQDEAGDLAASARRLLSESGLGRILQFAPEVQILLSSCEAAILPLYAALAVVHVELSGTPAARCIPTCWQLHGALAHLGFDGEVMAATALVLREGNGTPEQVGMPRGTPSLSGDGTTDGHAVYWADSFRQLVDPSIVLARQVQDAAAADPLPGFPVMLPFPDRDALLEPSVIGSGSRPGLRLVWGLFPHQTPALTPPPASELAARIEDGALALARATLEIIRELDGLRGDLAALRTSCPRLASLLDGSSMLPAASA